VACRASGDARQARAVDPFPSVRRARSRGIRRGGRRMARQMMTQETPGRSIPVGVFAEVAECLASDEVDAGFALQCLAPTQAEVVRSMAALGALATVERIRRLIANGNKDAALERRNLARFE